jgi:CHAT domain-containing protein
LYSFLWKPLEKWLKGVTTIYYAPAGGLHKINFDAIAVNKDEILGDRYRLVRLGSTRSLLSRERNSTIMNRSAYLFGDIQYSPDSSEIVKSRKAETGRTSEKSPDNPSGTKEYTAEPWSELAGTGAEIAEIKATLSRNNFITKEFTRKNASESLFKSIGKTGESPSVIHLATHGFFYPRAHSSGKKRYSEIQSGNNPVIVKNSDPMFRSGLLLYGGNYYWLNGEPYNEEGEDGLLMAFEISQMNLSRTELVVLSACETALGDIKGHEGVFGLQRAFKVAGVRYLIVSLWEVPDQSTADFMNKFYRNWIELKLSIPDAFRKTQKQMRATYRNPLDWAGFILIE